MSNHLKQLCSVSAGRKVEWDGQLTPSQCAAFPIIGEEWPEQPGRVEGFDQGSRASAYQHAEDPKKVVKFTADKDDAEVSALVMRKPLKGTVRVFDVAKLKGQKAVAPVVVVGSSNELHFETRPDQPVYGIITERVQPLNSSQAAAAKSFWDKYREQREEVRYVGPKRFHVGDHVEFSDAVAECSQLGGDKATCEAAMKDIFDAVDEQARELGVVPLDLHSRNWGVRNGRLVILDLGISAGKEARSTIRNLAGNSVKGNHMEKRRHPRRHSLGAFPQINWKSPWLWGGLAALGLVMFWPKKAKAAQKPVEKAPDVPIGSGTGTESTVPTGGSTTLATDPGSGVPIAGPTGSIPREMKRTVAKGESWANIASRAYGDYRWWPALWDYNRSGGTKFTDPSVLRVGDEIVVPALPQSAAFKAAIFARAEADRAWEIERARAKKAGKKFSKPRPIATMTATPVPSSTLPPGSPVSPPPAGSGGMEQSVPSAKEPLMLGPGSSGAPPTNQNPIPTTEQELDAQSREMQAELDARSGR